MRFRHKGGCKARHGGWAENAVLLKCIGFIWDLRDILTVHIFSERVQIQSL